MIASISASNNFPSSVLGNHENRASLLSQPNSLGKGEGPKGRKKAEEDYAAKSRRLGKQVRHGGPHCDFPAK